MVIPVPAHVPSPRQKVAEEAEVPELRFVTGRLPVTPVVRGSPVTLDINPLVGVPRTGAVKVGVLMVGEVRKTKLPVPVVPVVTTAPIVGLPVMTGAAKVATPLNAEVLLKVAAAL